MKKLLTICVSVLVIVIFLGLLPVHGEADVYDSVIRLHVLANSDSEEDQILKLKVRDAVLEKVATVCEENPCDNVFEAKRIIEESLCEIEEMAQKRIFDEGYDYDVEVLLNKEDYPTRNYEKLAFPSGEYLSLQVRIGEAEGKNWWCVLFPPLCLSAASDSVACSEAALIDIGLSGEQYKIITESENVKYNVRFKILETLDGVIS